MSPWNVSLLAVDADHDPGHGRARGVALEPDRLGAGEQRDVRVLERRADARSPRRRTSRARGTGSRRSRCTGRTCCTACCPRRAGSRTERGTGEGPPWRGRLTAAGSAARGETAGNGYGRARGRLGRVLAAGAVHLVELLGLRVVRLHVGVGDRPRRREPVVVPELAEVLLAQPVQRGAVAAWSPRRRSSAPAARTPCRRRSTTYPARCSGRRRTRPRPASSAARAAASRRARAAGSACPKAPGGAPACRRRRRCRSRSRRSRSSAQLLHALGQDDAAGGLDQREVRERLREVAQVPAGGDVELLGVEAERGGDAQQRSMRSRARCVSPMIASAETSQNEQITNCPPCPTGRRRSRRSCSAARTRSRSGRRRSPAPTCAQALVVAGQEPEHRRQQRGGVERVGVVVLAQHARSSTPCSRMSAWISCRGGPPLRSRAWARRAIAASLARPVHRHPAHELGGDVVLAACRAPPRSPGRDRATPRVAHSAWDCTIGHSRRGSRWLRRVCSRIESSTAPKTSFWRWSKAPLPTRTGTAPA